MGRGIHLQAAYKVAEDFEKTLTIKDFNGYIQVIHEEGTQMFFHCATARKWQKWYFIFPEHHDIHVYHEDEVQVCYFLKRENIEEI